MVGGEVIGLAREADGVTLLHVQDGRDVCAVRVKDDGRVGLGDGVWWQSGHVYWTPKENGAPHGARGRCGVDYDRPLLKVGYSHSFGHV